MVEAATRNTFLELVLWSEWYDDRFFILVETKLANICNYEQNNHMRMFREKLWSLDVVSWLAAGTSYGKVLKGFNTPEATSFFP